jgi:hypothetical protein
VPAGYSPVRALPGYREYSPVQALPGYREYSPVRALPGYRELDCPLSGLACCCGGRGRGGREPPRNVGDKDVEIDAPVGARVGGLVSPLLVGASVGAATRTERVTGVEPASPLCMRARAYVYIIYNYLPIILTSVSHRTPPVPRWLHLIVPRQYPPESSPYLPTQRCPRIRSRLASAPPQHTHVSTHVGTHVSTRMKPTSVPT